MRRRRKELAQWLHGAILQYLQRGTNGSTSLTRTKCLEKWELDTSRHGSCWTI